MSATVHHINGQANDTARLLCIQHQIAQAALASTGTADDERSPDLAKAMVCLLDHIENGDGEHIEQHLVYLAAQATAWLLVIERRKAAA